MTSEGPETQEKQNVHSLEVIKKRLRDAVGWMLLEMPTDMDLDAQKLKIVAHMEERGRTLFSEREDAFVTLTEKLRGTHFSSKEEMADEIADQFGSLMTTIATPEELETKLREEAAEQSGWTKINEALSYDLETEDEIILHVPMMFTKRPFEMFRLFEDGLRVLASRLKTDPRLKEIKQIFGYSWIIFEHPNLLKKLGFTVGERNEEERKALASISKEYFIARYGN